MKIVFLKQKLNVKSKRIVPWKKRVLLLLSMGSCPLQTNRFKITRDQTHYNFNKHLIFNNWNPEVSPQSLIPSFAQVEGSWEGAEPEALVHNFYAPLCSQNETPPSCREAAISAERQPTRDVAVRQGPGSRCRSFERSCPHCQGAERLGAGLPRLDA